MAVTVAVALAVAVAEAEVAREQRPEPPHVAHVHGLVEPEIDAHLLDDFLRHARRDQIDRGVAGCQVDDEEDDRGDAQDQRHRTVPGSRPLLSRTVPDCVDVVEPALVADDPVCHALFQEAVEHSWEARSRLLGLGVAPELAVYVLPNALAVRFEESGTLLDLLHKWNMRTCLNAQREIYQASMEELEQVRAVHPGLVRHVGPPCFVRSGLVRPRCTEGTHFCGVPVWRSFPDVSRLV